MRAAARVLIAVASTVAAAAQASDLEPARDALRRHEYERAVSLLQQPAEAGDPEAAFLLSQLLRYGRGTQQDLAGACRLLESSASAGFARAAGSIAAMLDSGDCRSSARTASAWREAARIAGYAPPPADSEAVAGEAAPQPEQLLRAARSGDLAQVQALLRKLGPDVADDFGRTSLMLAVEAGHDSVVRELIAHGASLAVADRSGETALLIAARKDSHALVAQMLARGAPVDLANDHGATALMLAAGSGSAELCNALLAAGADPVQRDSTGLSAGDYAARGGHAELAARLGVAPRQASRAAPRSGALHAGQSPLMIAAERGEPEALRQALAAGGDVDAADAQGLTALAYAARAGRTASVAALLDAGARTDARDRTGWTPLGHAVLAGQQDVARLLLKSGADPRATQGNGKPLLLLASQSGRADLVGALASAGADPNAGSPDGMTPLMAAAAAGDVNTVKALLASGARPDIADRRGRTALWYAATRDAPGVIPLLASRPIVNQGDDQGTTPLAAAVGQGNRRAVEALLNAGADARTTTRNGNSPLHVAAAAGQATLVPVLIGARVPIDAVNAQGDTALMLGIKSRCVACAKGLLVAGAGTRVRNGDGLSAQDIARLTRDPALIGLFE